MVPPSRQAVLTLGFVVAAFLVNLSSNFMPINGQTIGQISNTVFKEVLITPASYAFAIWGVIYVSLFAFAIYQLLPQQRRSPHLNPLRTMMILACGAQMIWIVVFLSNLYGLSLVAMVVIWGALMRGYFQINGTSQPVTRGQRWCIQVPWSLYLGWISVATLVNVALTLFAWNWQGGGISPQAWTVALIAVAMMIAMRVVWQHQDLAFAGVFLWALMAIAVRHSEVPLLGGSALGAAAGLGALSLYRWRLIPSAS
ncbi:tryptophan-rich sensory protein [Lyngbya confervoides]|uniref:Tryptophan-rich sensory protein n=1 Tax=Lyngbya confervoides BDU141951 TaxID=1574623 RepID=A0ABD4T7U5_9CYAN|nr:tryptophan-rich sensory protein [Lyngbya confervoides]MCM1984325.1 tryptophan-rich sensory protein [Lyngbya confervoides BDU141951]